MEAFENNPVGAPYDIKFNKIYEKMAEVTDETPEEPTAEQPTAEQPTEEPTAEEPTAEEPTAEEPTAEEPTEEQSVEEPTSEEVSVSEVVEESNTMNILLYVGLAILVGVALVFVYRNFMMTLPTNPESVSTEVVYETPEYSLETPTDTIYETSEYGVDTLSNLKYLKN